MRPCRVRAPARDLPHDTLCAAPSPCCCTHPPCSVQPSTHRIALPYFPMGHARFYLPPCYAYPLPLPSFNVTHSAAGAVASSHVTRRYCQQDGGAAERGAGRGERGTGEQSKSRGQAWGRQGRYCCMPSSAPSSTPSASLYMYSPAYSCWCGRRAGRGQRGQAGRQERGRPRSLVSTVEMGWLVGSGSAPRLPPSHPAHPGPTCRCCTERCTSRNRVYARLTSSTSTAAALRRCATSEAAEMSWMA